MSETERFSASSRVGVSGTEVFAWFERPGAFERLTPPWSGMRVVRSRGGIRNGGVSELRVPVGPFALPWTAVHSGYKRATQFVDEQRRGPFATWRHTHSFTPAGDMNDDVEYALPIDPLSRVARPFVRHELSRVFAYRQRIVAADLYRHRDVTSGQRIVVTGGTGFIGSVLVAFLRTGGHDVTVLTRKPRAAHERRWDPATGDIDGAALDGADVVIHLAGEPVAARRWSAVQRERILASREQSTRLLVRTIERLATPPRALVCASAIGYYGDRGDAVLDETSASGDGFLSDVCTAWEAASQTAATRVVNARFGIVVSPAGGALQRMLLPARLGVSGRVGDGKQQWSWVTLDDAV